MEQKALFEDGSTVTYEKCLIATGILDLFLNDISLFIIVQFNISYDNTPLGIRVGLATTS